MKYDLCSSCMWLQRRMLTETESIPKSCNCPSLKMQFGKDIGGFPTGIDIIHCDYHHQFPASCGDVMLSTQDNSHHVSYIHTQLRNSRLTRIVTLFDNSQNIRYLKLDNNG